MIAQLMQALGLAPDTVVVPMAGGSSGAAWKVSAAGRTYVLRVSRSERLMDGRLAAMAAARGAGLPAPELVARADSQGVQAALLSWLPGVTLLEVMMRVPSAMASWGRLMGEAQQRLHEIVAPFLVFGVDAEGVHPFDAGREVAGLPQGDRLLHLDWHLLNLLVDEASGELSGIVDWDDARRGHPLLDLARTHSVLTMEPSLAWLPTAVRPHLGAVAEAWAAGYGSEAGAIPAPCHTWAGRVMLADLHGRYRDTPESHDDLRRRTGRREEDVNDAARWSTEPVATHREGQE